MSAMPSPITRMIHSSKLAGAVLANALATFASMKTKYKKQNTDKNIKNRTNFNKIIPEYIVAIVI